MNGLFGFGGNSCGNSCGNDNFLWILILLLCCGDGKDCLCDILPLLLILCCCSAKKDNCPAGDCGCGC